MYVHIIQRTTIFVNCHYCEIVDYVDSFPLSTDVRYDLESLLLKQNRYLIYLYQIIGKDTVVLYISKLVTIVTYKN